MSVQADTSAAYSVDDHVAFVSDRALLATTQLELPSACRINVLTPQTAAAVIRSSLKLHAY